MTSTRWWEPAWATLLAVLLLGPALGPGYVLSYDMVWVPDLTLSPAALGLGSALPRAVPSDAVVAVLDDVVPGMLLQKAVLLGLLVAGGLGAARFLAGPSKTSRLVALTLWTWNPLVLERLVIGHWPLLVGYAALPWVLGAARSYRATARLGPLLWLTPIGCLSANAGLMTGVVVVVAGGSLSRRLLPLLALVAASNAPWLASGLLHVGIAGTDPGAAALFALGAEGGQPAPLAALSLGGTWNTEVVPASRMGAPGWVFLGVLLGLAAWGAVRWVRDRDPVRRRSRGALGVLWVVGYAFAVLTWAAPGVVSALAEHVPGGGVLRDGARWLVLCAPLTVALTASGAGGLLEALQERRAELGVGPVLAAVLAVVLWPLALLPDGAWGVSGRLAAVTYPDDYAVVREVLSEQGGAGATLVLPFAGYRQPAWNRNVKVLDPLARYLPGDTVLDDRLVVSGRTVAGEDRRNAAVARALDAPDAARRARALAAEGIGTVVRELDAGPAPAVTGTVLVETPRLEVVWLADVSSVGTSRGSAVAMTLAWVAFLFPLVIAAPARWRSRRRPFAAAPRSPR